MPMPAQSALMFHKMCKQAISENTTQQSHGHFGYNTIYLLMFHVKHFRSAIAKK